MSSEKGITLGELAKQLDAKLIGDPKRFIEGINTLSDATAKEISFFSRKKYLKDLKNTKACAVIIGKEDKDLASCDVLIAEDAYLLYAKATHVFKTLNVKTEEIGISDLADISSSARISASANIGPFCKISDDVEIGDKVSIGSGVTIGSSSKVGDKTLIYSNVSIYDFK